MNQPKEPKWPFPEFRPFDEKRAVKLLKAVGLAPVASPEGAPHESTEGLSAAPVELTDEQIDRLWDSLIDAPLPVHSAGIRSTIRRRMFARAVLAAARPRKHTSVYSTERVGGVVQEPPTTPSPK